MLEYSKIILTKVTFDNYLFEKELRKAIAFVGHEKHELIQWCHEHFGASKANILQKYKHYLASQ